MGCFYSLPMLSVLIPNPPFTSAIHSLHKGSCFNHRVGITLPQDRVLCTILLNRALSEGADFIIPFSGEVNTDFHGQLTCQPPRNPILWHWQQDCWVSCTEALQSYLGEDGRGWWEPQQLQLLCPQHVFCSKGGSFSPTFPGNEHLVLCSSLVTQAYP